MDSLFWNPRNSLTWRKGDFYFVAHHVHTRIDTSNHDGRLLYKNIPGKASIAKLDTNDANNSIILFDYPDSTAVINNMFSFRVDCDRYRTFVAVEGRGLEEVDFENKTFTPYCDFSFGYSRRGAGVPNGTWESCTVNIDLDLDDSSNVMDGGYHIKVDCPIREYKIVDNDFDLYADDVIDSIRITITNALDGSKEYLQVEKRNSFEVNGNETHQVSVINNRPSYFVDLRYMLKDIRYLNDAIPISEGSRLIKFEVFSGPYSDVAYTTIELPRFQYAGQDTVLSGCLQDKPIDLFGYLSHWASPLGHWSPEISESGVMFSDTGTYVYHYIVETESCMSDTAQIIIMVSPPLDVSYDVIDTRCDDTDDGQIVIANISGGIEGSDYEVFIDGAYTEGMSINGLNKGTYLLEIRQGSACSKSLSVEVGVESALMVELGEDIYIDEATEEITIESMIEYDKDITITWYHEGEEQMEDSEYFTLYPYKSCTIIIEVVDEDMCIAMDTIEIYVEHPNHVKIPNVIIPSDELELDRKFFIICSPYVELVSSMSIYNRWGNLVYEVHDLEPNNQDEPWWDGTSKGKNVVGGMYNYKFFVRLISGENIEYKGRLFLLR